MLGLRGKEQKFFNVCMKKRLSFFRGRGLRRSMRIVTVKIVQVGIYVALSASSVAVAEPSTAKSTTLEPNQGSFKVSDGSLQDRKFGGQLVAKSATVPTSEGGIKIAKLAQNNVSELRRGAAVSNVSLSGENAEDSDESAEDWDHCWWVGFLAWIPLAGAFISKPNVELTGAKPTGAASSDQRERG